MGDKPINLTAVRTEKALHHDNSALWTPKDMLAQALKDAETGTVKMKRAIILFQDEDNFIRMYSANTTTMEAMGMIELTKRNI